jgi:hypothetical protein
MATIGPPTLSVAGEYDPRAVLRSRRDHGSEPFRRAMGHGAQSYHSVGPDGVGPDASRFYRSIRIPLLDVSTYGEELIRCGI